MPSSRVLVQTDSGKNASSLGFSFLVRLAFVYGACCPSLMCHTTTFVLPEVIQHE
jgi:hypothetical protein